MDQFDEDQDDEVLYDSPFESIDSVLMFKNTLEELEASKQDFFAYMINMLS